MPTGPLVSASRLGLLALSTLALACEGSDNPLPAAPPTALNTAPSIVSLKIEPAIIDRGGSALVQAVVTDADGDGVVLSYEARHGQFSLDPAVLGRAVYKHDGSDSLEDLLTVAVTDARGAKATGSVALEIRPPEPAPTPTPTPLALKWSAWLNRDHPSGDGDWETRVDFGSAVGCASPVAVEGRAVATYAGVAFNPPIPSSGTGQVLTVSPEAGLYCVNAYQSDGKCHDYEVRFGCTL